MKKLSAKTLIEFKRKSPKGKKRFIESFKSPKISTVIEGGGDYWISAISAISNSYRRNDLQLISEKKNELDDKIENTDYKRTKQMYRRNILLLKKYEELEVDKLRPNAKLSFLKKSSGNSILSIKGLEIETKPSIIYLFENKGKEEVGSIWYIANIQGYNIEEVSMFCDLLYRFLNINYSSKYDISSRYCIVIDMMSGHIVNYSDFVNKALTKSLIPILDEINSFL